MSEKFKAFDDSGLTALTNHMKTTRASVGDLSRDLVTLSQATVSALEGKQDSLTFDSVPTSGSSNPVTSEGIKSYVDNAVGGGIPSVTTSDNGKFLRVVNGAWAAATVPNAEEVAF